MWLHSSSTKHVPSAVLDIHLSLKSSNRQAMKPVSVLMCPHVRLLPLLLLVTVPGFLLLLWASNEVILGLGVPLNPVALPFYWATHSGSWWRSSPAPAGTRALCRRCHYCVRALLLMAAEPGWWWPCRSSWQRRRGVGMNAGNPGSCIGVARRLLLRTLGPACCYIYFSLSVAWFLSLEFCWPYVFVGW